MFSVLIIASAAAAGVVVIGRSANLPKPALPHPLHRSGTVLELRDEPPVPFDPVAFWLFPDWDSGPIKQPFWMRPLKSLERPLFSGLPTVPGKPPPAWERIYLNTTKGARLIHLRRGDFKLIEAGETATVDARDIRRIGPGLALLGSAAGRLVALMDLGNGRRVAEIEDNGKHRFVPIAKN